MAFIRTKKVNGKIYYALVENHRVDGKVKQRVLKSFGTTKPNYNFDDEKGQDKLQKILSLKNPQFPDGKFTIILADPPWQYSLRENDKSHRGRTNYPTMTSNDILKLPVKNLAQEDAYLFLWVTKDHLQLGLEVLEKWGFSYKNILTWVKVSKAGKIRIMTGHWGRNCTEFVLIGSRGKAKCFSSLGIRNIPTAFEAEVKGHSQKPTIPLLERLCEVMPDAPKIELFAREPHSGWQVWGNEV